jgi:hypothetical protein
MKNFHAAAQKRFRRLLGQLQEAQVLTARQADGLKLQLKIHATDLRENPQPPLPAFNVE